MADGDRFALTVDRVAKGGAALGPGPDGRVVFCDRTMPGETVEAEVTALHRSRIEATTISVEHASPDRVASPCSMVAAGCGGCDWQHISPDAQSRLRTEIVRDSLRRLAKLEAVEVRNGPRLDPTGYRTTIRAAVRDGRAGYRRRAGNEIVAADECVIAHPLAAELLIEGRFGDASEVVIRVGANTGERMVILDPGVGPDVRLPSDVGVIGRDAGRQALQRAHIHEQLAGIRMQVSAESFFQCRPDGAEVLAQVAGDAVADTPGTLLDAYCGVGLFGTLAGTGRSVIGVESNPDAANDARHNLGSHARVDNERFEHWRPEPVGVAIADPARVGLRVPGCDQLAATGAAAIALVSCDPASLARDANLLIDRGYNLDHVTVLDLFGHTSHVETVSRFIRR